MLMGLRAASLAAVSLLTLALAIPAQAEDVTVTGIATTGPFQMSVPTVEATNTNLTEAQIRRIFTGDFATTASSLAELDAGNISIPEIAVTYDLPKSDGSGTEKTTVVYSDIVLSDVVDGVAGSAAVGSSVVGMGNGTTLNVGTMSTSNFDIGALLAFYGLGSPTASDEFKTVYADFAFEGASMSGPGFSCDIGGAAVDEFKARPLKVNFTEFATMIASVEDKEAPPPAVVRKLVDFYIDILTAFQSTPMTGGSFDCSGDDGKGGTIKVSSGDAEFGGFEPGIYPHFAINDVAVDVTGKDAGSMSLGNLTWKPMDFSAPIATLKAAPLELTEAWFQENWRKLVPAIEGMSLADLALDVPNPEKPGDRVQLSLGSLDVSLADYVNGLPSNIGVTTNNLLVQVPATGKEGKLLSVMGIDQLDLSQDVQLHWNRGNSTIVIDAISIDGADLGTIKVSGVLGNATEQLFSDNNNVALAAAMGLTLKEITFDLDDRGLSGLLMAVAAAEQGQDPNVMRVGMAGLAQAMILGLIGTTPEAMAASEEMATFVKSKPKVIVTLTANDEAGIALPLLMAASENPALLSGQIGIKAAASGDARPADKAIELPKGGMVDDDAIDDETSDDSDAMSPDDGAMSETQTDKQSLKN